VHLKVTPLQPYQCDPSSCCCCSASGSGSTLLFSCFRCVGGKQSGDSPDLPIMLSFHGVWGLLPSSIFEVNLDVLVPSYIF
jgi:hypothetical protein